MGCLRRPRPSGGGGSGIAGGGAVSGVGCGGVGAGQGRTKGKKRLRRALGRDQKTRFVGRLRLGGWRGWVRSGALRVGHHRLTRNLAWGASGGEFRRVLILLSPLAPQARTLDGLRLPDAESPRPRGESCGWAGGGQCALRHGGFLRRSWGRRGCASGETRSGGGAYWAGGGATAVPRCMKWHRKASTSCSCSAGSTSWMPSRRPV